MFSKDCGLAIYPKHVIAITSYYCCPSTQLNEQYEILINFTITLLYIIILKKVTIAGREGFQFYRINFHTNSVPPQNASHFRRVGQVIASLARRVKDDISSAMLGQLTIMSNLIH